jgi:hypothetical protein
MFRAGAISTMLLVAMGMSPRVDCLLHADARRPAYPIVHEIQVDEDCRVMPDPAHPVVDGKKPKPRVDELVCQIDGEHNSERVEETIVGNERRRTRVAVDEKEFVLQNITQDRVIFVVEQPVGKGWMVDSDPQPAELRKVNSGSLAVFRVYAEPGEIVHLHVGARHTTPMKTKIIRTAAAAN